MTQETEKDNFWVYIGGVIFLAVALVVVFKSQKAALEPGVGDASAQAESKAEVDKALARIHSQK